METIIGLLFVLLPLIFKLIGSRLEKSGQSGKSGKLLREFGEALDGEDSPMNDWKYLGQELFGNSEPESASEPASVSPVSKPSAPVVETDREFPVENVIRQMPASSKMPKSPMIAEKKESKRKGEKIDPKKLVIYSEIMKPKYTE